jgi:D-alanine-D-alanine ligase
MKIGIAYDLKMAFTGYYNVDDALEEYDSPETVEILTTSIESRGHEVIKLGGGEEFIDNIRRETVDIVFNIAEGRGSYRSREAQIPAILEMLDIPYTGSDPQCLTICLDKPLTKKLVATDGVITPKCLLISGKREDDYSRLDYFPFPAIIKPAWEGSSKGVHLTSLVHNIEQAHEEVSKILENYQQPVMIEEFVNGDEVTVGIVGNNPPRILGMMRILPKKRVEYFIYSVEVKRDYVNLTDYECPVNMPETTLAGLKSASLSVFKTLGCRDFSRIDFRVSHDGTPYFIEINPLPGLGSYSDLIIMAKMLRWTHEQVIGAVLDAALERYPKCVNV